MIETTPTTGDAAQLNPNRWRILVVLCLSLMVIMIANGSLNTALPALADDLHASASSLQWMVDAYSLVFAGMLFTAGTLGDRFGRKRVLQGGMILFLVGAVWASTATSAGVVIAARGLMGFAAAFVMPSTLSLLTNVFPAHERPKAISMWAGIAAGGAALGPPLSGFLIEHFWWGSVFLINVPLIVIALVAGWFLLPESKDPEEHRVDVSGAALSIVGVGTLVYAIIEAPNRGWTSPQTLIWAGVAVVAFLAFVWREKTAAEPMFDVGLVRNPRFSVASAGIALCFFAMFGLMFLLTQYLQLVLGYSPFHAGLLVLPMPMTMMLVAPRAPQLVGRFGISRVVPVGLGLVAIGLCATALLGTDSPGVLIYAVLFPVIVGISITATPFTSMIMTSVPVERAGMGSATNDTTRELGGALGVAVLGSLVTTHFRSGLSLAGLPADAVTTARTGLAGALEAAGRLPADAAGRLVADARSAYTEGMAIAGFVAAGVIVATAVAATATLRRASSSTAAAQVADHAVDPVAAAEAELLI